MEGNWHFEIDWTSLIAGSKFTVFALSLRALFFKYKPPGGLYLERPFNRGFFRYEFGSLSLEGLIFGILRYLYNASDASRTQIS